MDANKNLRLARFSAGFAIGFLAGVVLSGAWLYFSLYFTGGFQKAALSATVVEQVVDGDTIKIRKGETQETVRLIGINTPEVESPYRRAECFGKEASEAARQLLSGKEIVLVKDPNVSDRDKYGRLLRYVFLADGSFINASLVREGFAYFYLYEPFQFASFFGQLEQEAKQTNKGLWGQCIKKLQN